MTKPRIFKMKYCLKVGEETYPKETFLTAHSKTHATKMLKMMHRLEDPDETAMIEVAEPEEISPSRITHYNLIEQK